MDSLLLSLLARQLSLLGERFERRYPHEWLVWEPGSRMRPADATESDTAATRVPGVTQPRGDDAVCIPLLRPKAESVRVSVGRAQGNAIQLEDMTISREHLQLYVFRGEWCVVLRPNVTLATQVRGMSLQPGEPVRLLSGCRIDLGSVRLTFYDGADMRERLTAELKRQGA